MRRYRPKRARAGPASRTLRRAHISRKWRRHRHGQTSGITGRPEYDLGLMGGERGGQRTLAAFFEDVKGFRAPSRAIVNQTAIARTVHHFATSMPKEKTLNT